MRLSEAVRSQGGREDREGKELPQRHREHGVRVRKERNELPVSGVEKLL
jgi:hypothetical protein